jgi:hypothetical protein
VWVPAGILGVSVVFGGLAGCGEAKVQSPNEKTAAPARAPGQNIQQEKRFMKNTS